MHEYAREKVFCFGNTSNLFIYLQDIYKNSLYTLCPFRKAHCRHILYNRILYFVAKLHIKDHVHIAFEHNHFMIFLLVSMLKSIVLASAIRTCSRLSNTYVRKCNRTPVEASKFGTILLSTKHTALSDTNVKYNAIK